MKKLSEKDLLTLKQGARHPGGVIHPIFGAGFGRHNEEKRMVRLVAAGLAVKNPHGDWYITGKGRDVVRAEEI